MIEVSNQTLIFLQSCLLGIVLGIIYDVFRVIRRAIKVNTIITFIQDFIFFILAAIITFTFFLQQTDGEMRMFVVIGELLGWVVYYLTIGKLVIKISESIIKVIKNIFKLIYNILIKRIIRIIIKIYSKIKKILIKFKLIQKKYIQNSKYHLKKKEVLLYNLIKRKNKEK